jgi:hypothetical protein
VGDFPIPRRDYVQHPDPPNEWSVDLIRLHDGRIVTPMAALMETGDPHFAALVFYSRVALDLRDVIDSVILNGETETGG